MSISNRYVAAAITLAVAVAIAFASRGLWLELLSDKWTTPLQPYCLKLGLASGAVVGMAIGCAVFFFCLRRRRGLLRSLTAVCAAAAISGVPAAILSFMAIGSTIWPPEIPHGFDPDNLIPFGFVGGLIGAVVSTGLLAAGAPTHES